MAKRLTEEEASVLARYVARPSPIGHADRVARTLYDRGVLHQQANHDDIRGSRDTSTRLYSPWVIPLTNGYVPLDAVLGEKEATITLDAHRCALWRTVAQGIHIPIDPKNHAVLQGQKEKACKAKLQRQKDQGHEEARMRVELRGPPTGGVCCITGEPFVNPVRASDGHWYEKSAIERMFALGIRYSPKTCKLLPDSTLVPPDSTLVPP